jgi:hypothetical protein
MSNSPMVQIASSKAGWRTAGRWLALALGVGVIAPAIGHAQLTTPTVPVPDRQMKSGLHWISEQHIAAVTVSDVGQPGALSSVRIELRDPTDRLVAAADGQLRPGVPVRLRSQIKAGAGLQQLSAYVSVTNLSGGPVPMTVFEDIGPDGFVARIIVCGPPGHRGGGQEMCPGWFLTTAGI